MSKFIKQFYAFLFRVMRTAVVQVAADTLNEIAYPGTARVRGVRRHFNSNAFEEAARRSRYHGPTRDIFEKRRGGSTVEELSETFKDHGKDRFHDVLMVAFDLTGPNEAVVHEWLSKVMIPAKHYPAPDIMLDSWWIADDNAEGDLDSAVFVKKGRQLAARKLLRDYRLAN